MAFSVNFSTLEANPTLRIRFLVFCSALNRRTQVSSSLSRDFRARKALTACFISCSRGGRSCVLGLLLCVRLVSHTYGKFSPFWQAFDLRTLPAVAWNSAFPRLSDFLLDRSLCLCSHSISELVMRLAPNRRTRIT